MTEEESLLLSLILLCFMEIIPFPRPFVVINYHQEQKPESLRNEILIVRFLQENKSLLME